MLNKIQLIKVLEDRRFLEDERKASLRDKGGLRGAGPLEEVGTRAGLCRQSGEDLATDSSASQFCYQALKGKIPGQPQSQTLELGFPLLEATFNPG